MIDLVRDVSDERPQVAQISRMQSRIVVGPSLNG